MYVQTHEVEFPTLIKFLKEMKDEKNNQYSRMERDKTFLSIFLLANTFIRILYYSLISEFVWNVQSLPALTLLVMLELVYWQISLSPWWCFFFLYCDNGSNSHSKYVNSCLNYVLTVSAVLTLWLNFVVPQFIYTSCCPYESLQ